MEVKQSIKMSWLAIAGMLSACAGPTAFQPSGGVIFVPKKADPERMLTDGLVIYSDGKSVGQLQIWCYQPKDIAPKLVKFTMSIKSFLFSSDDNQSCEYVGVSQISIADSFSKAAILESPVKQNNNTSQGEAQPINIAKIRNSYAMALLSIDEYNCKSFLNSTFSTRVVADTQKDFISTLGTGISAGTAISSPTLSAGVGVGNLVFGAGSESINKNIYLDKTAEALVSAISSNRFSGRGKIIENLAKPYDAYPLDALLSDLSGYRSLCSISAGAAELNRVASEKLALTAKVESDRVLSPPISTDRTTETGDVQPAVNTPKNDKPQNSSQKQPTAGAAETTVLVDKLKSLTPQQISQIIITIDQIKNGVDKGAKVTTESIVTSSSPIPGVVPITVPTPAQQ